MTQWPALHQYLAILSSWRRSTARICASGMMCANAVRAASLGYQGRCFIYHSRIRRISRVSSFVLHSSCVREPWEP